MNKKRIEFIDIVRAFAIILVMGSHSFSGNSIYKVFITDIDVPLFFVIAGTMIKDKTDFGYKSLLEFAKKKGFAIVLPYFLWGLIYSRLTIGNVFKLVYGSHSSLNSADTLTALWFLPVIALAELWCFVILGIDYKCFKDTRFESNLFIRFIYCVILFCIGFTLPYIGEKGYPWGFNISFVAAGFIMNGHILKMLFSTKVEHISTKRWAILAGVFSVAYLMLFQKNPIEEGYVLVARGRYGNPYIFLFIAMIGVGAAFSIAICTDRLCKHKRAILYVGQNTMGILFIHKPFTRIFAKIATHAGYKDNFLIISCGIVITLLISFIVIEMIKILIPELLGKKGR